MLLFIEGANREERSQQDLATYSTRHVNSDCYFTSVCVPVLIWLCSLRSKTQTHGMALCLICTNQWLKTRNRFTDVS